MLYILVAIFRKCVYNSENDISVKEQELYAVFCYDETGTDCAVRCA